MRSYDEALAHTLRKLKTAQVNNSKLKARLHHPHRGVLRSMSMRELTREIQRNFRYRYSERYTDRLASELSRRGCVLAATALVEAAMASHDEYTTLLDQTYPSALALYGVDEHGDLLTDDDYAAADKDCPPESLTPSAAIAELREDPSMDDDAVHAAELAYAHVGVLDAYFDVSPSTQIDAAEASDTATAALEL